MKPIRVQLKRTKGYRMPPNTVKVGRPTKWGNWLKPDGSLIIHWTEKDTERIQLNTVADCAKGFELLMRDDADDKPRVNTNGEFLYPSNQEIRQELRGKHLACFCPLDQPCHADVLLEIANEPDPA